MSKEVPAKLAQQIAKAGLPTVGRHPFVPKIGKNFRGDATVLKAPVLHGPKKGKRGYVDQNDRIWVRDRAHAGDPDHWDVQEDGGRTYFRIDDNGNLLP